MPSIIYLDNAATMPVSKETAEKSAVFLDTEFYNPSAGYSGGIETAKQISSARSYLLGRLGGDGTLVFTGSATEANNYIINSGHKNKRGNIVISKGEHPSITVTATASGANVKHIGLNSDGTVNEAELLSMIDSNTSLVSVFHVSNETGAINDINKLAHAVKEINPNVIFSGDGVQAFCKYGYSLSNDIDLYSISAHKIGGTKGVGGLFIKKGLNLRPCLYGGGQEGGLRSGTENVYGIMSFEYAARSFEKKNGLLLKERFLMSLKNSASEKSIRYTVNGNGNWIISISFEGIKGEILQRLLGQRNIFVGKGAACSGNTTGNRTLEAMKVPKKLIDESIRVSFGWQNTPEEAETAGRIITEVLSGM